MSLELEVKKFGENIDALNQKLEKFGNDANEGKKAIAEIRDQLKGIDSEAKLQELEAKMQRQFDDLATKTKKPEDKFCLLYTSDAADDTR